MISLYINPENGRFFGLRQVLNTPWDSHYLQFYGFDLLI